MTSSTGPWNNCNKLGPCRHHIWTGLARPYRAETYSAILNYGRKGPEGFCSYQRRTYYRDWWHFLEPYLWSKPKKSCNASINFHAATMMSASMNFHVGTMMSASTDACRDKGITTSKWPKKPLSYNLPICDARRLWNKGISIHTTRRRLDATLFGLSPTFDIAKQSLRGD